MRCLPAIMDPHSKASKENTSHGNKVLPQNTMLLIKSPCYQEGNLCQDPAGNRTTLRPPDHHKETQTAAVWTCLPFIRSGQNHLARAQWKGEEDKADRISWENNIREWTPCLRGQWRTEKKRRKLIVKSSVGALMTLTAKGWVRRWGLAMTDTYKYGSEIRTSDKWDMNKRWSETCTTNERDCRSTQVKYRPAQRWDTLQHWVRYVQTLRCSLASSTMCSVCDFL